MCIKYIDSRGLQFSVTVTLNSFCHFVPFVLVVFLILAGSSPPPPY